MFYPYERLNFIKNSDHFAIKFKLNDKELFLIPVNNTDEVVFKIGSWREKFFDAFPSKFYVTYNGTKNWLKDQVLENNDRFLFLIKDEDNILGHLGFFRFNKEKNSCEIDNVVKGTSGYKGLMTHALMSVIGFAFEDLMLSSLTLRVFDDNKRAKSLYKRCGFKEKQLIPLIKNKNGIYHDWVEIKDSRRAERFFCEMILKSK